MARLEYDFAVVGMGAIANALASVERLYARHNAKMLRMSGVPVGQRSPASLAQTQRGSVARINSAERESIKIWREKVSLAKRYADIQVQAERKARNAVVTQQRASERARRQFRERTMGRIGSSVAGSVRAIGSAALGALAVGGGFGVASAIQNEMDIRARASSLANQAGRPELKGRLARESGSVQGFTGAEVLSSIEGFVTRTGDLDTARKMMKDLGQLSLATGADLGQLGEAAGQAFNVIRDTIKDPAEQLSALNDVMSTLAAQGTLGAVEIKDMATELAGLGAATRKFKGGPVELLKTIGAMAQASVARGGAQSAAEATTAVTRFADDIIQNNGKFTAQGVNVFADKKRTQLRAPDEIMADVLAKTGGDLTKIDKMFGVFAARAVGGFAPLYTEAEKHKKGSGRDAVREEFQRFIGAQKSKGEIDRLAASRLADPDMQFKEALKQFNVAVGTQLLPAVTKLIPHFIEMIPAIERWAGRFEKFTEFLLQNPFEGLGAIIGAKVVADIAAAGLGEAVSVAITNGIASKFAAGGIVIGSAMVGIEMARLFVASMEKEAERKFDAAEKGSASIRERAQKELDERGRLSQETRNELLSLDMKESERINSATNFSKQNSTGILGTAGDLAKGAYESVTGSGPGIGGMFAGLEDSKRGEELIRANEETKKLVLLDQIAQKFEHGAESVKNAAKEMAASRLNTGNSPSPVKP